MRDFEMAKLTTEDLTGERSPSRLLRRIHRLLVTRVDSLFDDERLIDSLEEIGYVKRDLSSSDRRVVRLVLTKSGEAKHAERIPIMVASWNEILADFKKQEAEQLIRLL